MLKHYSRIAALCLFLFSADSVNGKIRGFYTDGVPSLGLEEAEHDGNFRRVLKHKKRGKHQKEKGYEEEATAYPTTEQPLATHTNYPIVYESEHTMEPTEYYKGAQKSGKNKGGKQNKKGGKGSKESSEKTSEKSKGVSKYNTDGKKEGGKSAGKAYEVKAGQEYEEDKNGSYKSSKTKGSTGSKGSKRSRTSGKSTKYKGAGDGPVLKKWKSTKDTDKSQYKLTKSSDEYTDEPTYHPSELENQPTLVEVPVSFYFAFSDPAKRRKLEEHDGSYEPTPEDIATFEGAIKEYAIGLFAYLHQAKPETLYSVAPTIDKVIIKKGAEYPLQIDVTFHILYNEPPENTPDPAEVASILKTAFESEEFTYFYLWGRDDIWNSVTSIKVEPNIPEVADEPSSPDVNVFATMLYDLSIANATEPTEDDFAILEMLTQTFFLDVLTDLYKNNPDTIFEEIIVTREDATFDPTATPPVSVDYSFLVKFDENSLVIPSGEELFRIMAAGDQTNMFESYIRLYLTPSQSLWSTVSRISFLEPLSQFGETEATDEPFTTPNLVVVPASMVYSFFEGTASRPGEADYDKLQMATDLFFIETLTIAFKDNPAAGFVTATTDIQSSFYTEGIPEPLRVDYNTQVFLEGSSAAPTPEEIFTILQDADYDSYIRNYLWPEGAPWNNVNGVMYLERIVQTPPPS